MDEHTPGEGGPANTPPFPRIVPERPGDSAGGRLHELSHVEGMADEDDRVVAEGSSRPVIEEPDIRGGDRHHAQPSVEDGGKSEHRADAGPLPPRTGGGSTRARGSRSPGPFAHFADRLDEVADRIDHVVDRQLAAAGVAGRTADAGHGASEAIGGIADYLRSSDLRTLREDLARQVRERPLQAVLVAVGTGWLFGKIVR